MWNKTHIWSSFLVLLVSVTTIPFYYYMIMDIDDLTEISKCPLCFGQSMCNFSPNYLSLLWIYLVNIFIHNKKLVFFGSYNGVTAVFKKPPKESLLQFYNNHKITDFLLSNEYITELLKVESTPGNSSEFKRFILCPTPEKLEIFYSPVIKSMTIGHNLKNDLLHLLFITSISIEPLIQQVTKDWAVAEFLGSCGTIYVSKYCGETLTKSFPQLNWTERSLIAIQLLQFAFNATLKNANFSFYFTDLTADNFAVNSEGDVRLIDLEDVIVVDRTPRDPPPEWNKPHKNLHDDSVNGIMFSHQEICSHHISDLNIYSICQGILSEKSDLLTGGLLHSPPHNFMNIRTLINDCISSPGGTSRFELAQDIIEMLHVHR